jgi:histidinol-phosphate aminotransferase
MSLPIRDELKNVSAYGAPQIDVPVKLNTNENPYSPPAALIEAIAKNIAAIGADLNRYPDRDSVALREGLALYVERESGVSVSHDQVWAANGSNEIMLQILQAFGGPGRKALTFSPTYSMYVEYARDTNTEFIAIPRKEDFSIDADLVLSALKIHRPTVVFLASPNNPTGTALDLEVLDTVLKTVPNTIFVVDEAYAEFRRKGVESAVSRVAKHSNLVVTRTMSKAFALAGVRLGYLISSVEMVETLKLVRLPYHLSSVTQVVANTALQFADELQKDIAEIRADRDDFLKWARNTGFEAADSDANFVLLGQFNDRHAAWQALVERGVLVREVGPENWLRITIGTKSEMTVLKNALLEVRGM